MKKIIYLLSTGIIAALVVSSCATSNDVVSNGLFQKRKYNKGYHISRSGKNQADKTGNQEVLAASQRTEQTSVSSLPAKHLSVNLSTERQYDAIPMGLPTAVRSAEAQTAPGSINGSSSVQAFASSSQKHETVSEEHAKTHTQTLTQKQEQHLSGAGSAIINLILLIILAIILPPLAVGIATDWAIGPLLLSILLTILFWLPGVIYALIVVLNA